MTGIALSQASLLNAQALGMMTGMVGSGVGISSTEVPLTLTLTHSGAPTQVLIPEFAAQEAIAESASTVPLALDRVETVVEHPATEERHTWQTLTTSAPRALVDLDLDPLLLLHTYRATAVSTTAHLATNPENRSSTQSDRVWRRPVSARDLAQQAAELRGGNAPIQVDESPISNGRVARPPQYFGGLADRAASGGRAPDEGMVSDRTRPTEIVFLDAAQRDSETAGPVVQSEDYPALEVDNGGLQDQRLPSDFLRSEDILGSPQETSGPSGTMTSSDTLTIEATELAPSGIAFSLPTFSAPDTLLFPTADEASFAGIEVAVSAPATPSIAGELSSTESISHTGPADSRLGYTTPPIVSADSQGSEPIETAAIEVEPGAVVLPFPSHRSVPRIRGTGDSAIDTEGTHGTMPTLWQSMGRTEPPAAAQTHWNLVARLTETGFAPPYAAEAPGLHRDGQSPVHPLFGALPQEREAEPEAVPEWDKGLVARIRRALEKAGFIDKATGALRELTTAQDGIALSDVLTGLAEADLGGLYV